jgi:hypothetical protein
MKIEGRRRRKLSAIFIGSWGWSREAALGGGDVVRNSP